MTAVNPRTFATASGLFGSLAGGMNVRTIEASVVKNPIRLAATIVARPPRMRTSSGLRGPALSTMPDAKSKRNGSSALMTVMPTSTV